MENEEINRTQHIVPEEKLKQKRVSKADRVFDEEDYFKQGVSDIRLSQNNIEKSDPNLTTRQDYINVAKDAVKKSSYEDALSYMNEDEEDNEYEEDDEFNEDDELDIDDIIGDMSKEQKTASIEKQKKALEDYKETSATRELLFSRTEEPISIPIIINDDEVITFKAKRLNEIEVQSLMNRKLIGKKIQNIMKDKKKWAEFMEYNYKLLESVIVEPKLTREEWKTNVDSALVTKLSDKVSLLINNTDDTIVLGDFEKKSQRADS